MKRTTLLFPVAMAVVLAGCSHQRAARLDGWRDALGGVREQSGAVFDAVNVLARERQIERAALQPALHEALFADALREEDLRVWRGALDALVAYAGAVEALNADPPVAGAGDAARALAGVLAARAGSPVFSGAPGVAGAVGALAEAVMRAGARASARSIVREADPAVHDLLTRLAATISETDEAGDEVGVVVTVRANWGTALGGEQAAFLAPGADRAAVARRYARLLDSRAAALGALESLRSSLLALAEEHRAIGAGVGDVAPLIARVREDVVAARALIKAARTPSGGV